jgi:uncharacterized protein (TIGR00288 family)
LAEHESSIAVLVDFENMARPGVKGRGDFDIHLVLNRLADKGRVLVKRAYADWSRYRDARHDLQNAGLELIEMPSAREGAKNRADIKMAVDAMELAFNREHVDTFVIVSGDSDFTPLVGKLRELNKRVTGMGNRDSASELLIANCDEFIFYDSLAASARAAGSGGGRSLQPLELLRQTLTALQREGTEWPLASVVKDSMRRKNPAFDENEAGFGTFSKFLEAASQQGVVRLEPDPRSGTYRVELAEGTAAAAPPASAAPAGPAARTADAETDGDTGPRRRRRRRRGDTTEGADAPEATDAVAPAAPGAEVFEFVVEATPADLSASLPPLDQPISYEDMILLGPELDTSGDDAEVPVLVEASDAAAAPAEEAAPTSRRRRRRRGGAAEGESEAEAVTPPVEAPVAEAPAAEPVAEAPAEEAPAPASRRRRRRGSVLPAEESPAVETPAAEPEPAAEPAPEPVAEAPAAVETPPAEDAVPTRRRVRRGTRVAALLEPEAAPAEAPAAEEAPAPKRRTRKTAAQKAAEQAEAAAAPEAPAEEKPKRRTRTRKTAEPAAE